MNYKIKDDQDVVKIQFTGDIIYEEISIVKNEIIDFVIKSKKDVDVDFSHVNYIDSTGIGFLLRLSVIQKGKNKKFKVSNISDRIAKILELSSLGGAI